MNALFTGIQQMCANEFRQIDEAAEVSCNNAHKWFNHLGDELKSVAVQTIDDIPIHSVDANPDAIHATLERIGRYVAEKVSRTGFVMAEKMQLELQSNIAAELDRLYEFVVMVDYLARHAERRLAKQTSKAVNDENMLTAKFKQWWAICTETEPKDITTFVGIGLLLAALRIPTLSSAMLILTVPDISSQIQNVNQLKEYCKKVVREEIDRHIQEVKSEAERLINSIITGNFNNLQCLIEHAIDCQRSDIETLPLPNS